GGEAESITQPYTGQPNPADRKRSTAIHPQPSIARTEPADDLLIPLSPCLNHCQPLTKVKECVSVHVCVEGGGSGEGGGREGGWVDGVNTPAYMDWANIQFVPSRLSSTVAATQFLPIDLPATGTITLHRRNNGPRIRSSQQRRPDAGGASPERSSSACGCPPTLLARGKSFCM
ncbi:hypothetical protein L3Q82_015975, partial [Scortum barcoo]